MTAFARAPKYDPSQIFKQRENSFHLVSLGSFWSWTEPIKASGQMEREDTVFSHQFSQTSLTSGTQGDFKTWCYDDFYNSQMREHVFLFIILSNLFFFKQPRDKEVVCFE